MTNQLAPIASKLSGKVKIPVTGDETNRIPDMLSTSMDHILPNPNLDNVQGNTFNKLAVSYQLILTKVDKIKAKELNLIIERVKKECNINSAAHPFVHLTSSAKGIGIDFLRADIARLI